MVLKLKSDTCGMRAIIIVVVAAVSCCVASTACLLLSVFMPLPMGGLMAIILLGAALAILGVAWVKIKFDAD
jgi:hypothetical protein